MYDADQFAAHLILLGKADNTIRNYRCLYQRWLDWCATNERDAALLHPADVRAWSRTIHGSRPLLGQAAAVINHACRLHGAVESGAAIPVPREPNRPSRALPIAKASAMEAEAKVSGDAGTAAMCGLYTAARRSEIAAMEWEKFEVERDPDTGDFLGGFITYWRPKTRDWLTIPYHPVLAEYLEPRRGGQWLFPGRWGGHVSPATIWKWIIKVAEQARIGHVTPHQLRHTALSRINDLTGDLRAAQLIAGHTDPSQTAKYTYVDQERVARAMAALNYNAA